MSVSRPVPPIRTAALFLTAALLLPAPAGAQAPDVVGRWEGTMDAGPQGEILMAFVVTAAEDGALASTLDVPSQGARGMPTGTTTLTGDTLLITVPAIQGSYRGVRREDGGFDGTWSQGPASLPLDLVRVERPTELERPQDPEPPYPYRVEEVTYANPDAGITLAGTFTRPEGDAVYPAVLLISGSGPQDRDEALMGHRPFLVLADHLTRAGVAVLRVDDRGVGGSGGEFAGATSRDFASDVRAGVAWLDARADVAQVGLVGHSEGGLVAPMVAAADPAVDFIVLLAGPGVPGREILPLQTALVSRAAGLPEEVVELTREMVAMSVEAALQAGDEVRRDSVRAVVQRAVAGVDPALRPMLGVPADDREAWLETQVDAFTSPWMVFFLGHDPRDDLRRVDVPVLALNGSLDLQVPPSQNLPEIERAVREGGNDRVTVHELEGLNHLFQHARTGSPAEYATLTETFAPEAMALVARWILEITGG